MPKSVPLYTLCFSSSRGDCCESETTPWERCGADGKSLCGVELVRHWTFPGDLFAYMHILTIIQTDCRNNSVHDMPSRVFH